MCGPAGPATVDPVKIVEIRRFPIKSLVGEVLTEVDVDRRGLVGDRLWAVLDPDGKLGSGKNSDRFRRMAGLLDLRAHFGDPVPDVELPDGRRFAADDPKAHAAVSEIVGRPVTIGREDKVFHHDDGPVSVITTAGMRALGDILGEIVDPAHFRANFLVDVPCAAFVEDGWVDADIRIGADLVLRPVGRLPRCVMIDMAQGDMPEHGNLLRTLGDHHDRIFGLWADVERPGRVALNDPVTLLR